MKIVFRADASLQIGTGHLIRCLALADAMREEGADVHFVFRTQPRFKDEIVTNSGHYLHFLSTPESSHGASGLANADDCPIHAEWLGVRWEQDAEECAAVLKSIGRPDWLVVDHYALDARWEESLCGSVGRIMVIDDLADRKHDCDVLLDQTLAANEVNYRTLVPRACRLLLGPEYALLRPQFAACRVEAEARRKKNQEIRRILVAMGGLDCINSTSTVLRGLALLQSHDLEVTVILGSLAPHVDKVMRLAEKTPFSAHVLTDVRNMAVLMVEHDVCVGSAG
ncbi:MAG: UDP-2,4-diacetamido-2,4,6-trideoxy-beta-L-altropyranose hydrolase, partial [Deltaproteobacteria bacterium]|nr:UDP-2,4-diacetamido-2,4,6-trideoxy-beta-L-altropyranose hydrolase [Deltaproteobacteria bacterium]